jgi:hypothetical protein
LTPSHGIPPIAIQRGDKVVRQRHRPQQLFVSSEKKEINETKPEKMGENKVATPPQVICAPSQQLRRDDVLMAGGVSFHLQVSGNPTRWLSYLKSFVSFCSPVKSQRDKTSPQKRKGKRGRRRRGKKRSKLNRVKTHGGPASVVSGCLHFTSIINNRKTGSPI